MGVKSKGLGKETVNKVENIPIGNEFSQGIQLFEIGDYEEAIEAFAMILGRGEDLLARQYLGRCYYRIDKYESAYRHFSELLKADGELRDYGCSMIAAIDIIRGKYDKAIKALRDLPKNTNNLVNLSMLYWKKYQAKREEHLLFESLKILNKIDVTSVAPVFIKRIFHQKAVIFQAQKEFCLAERFYLDAIPLAENDPAKGQIINDYASLYIEIGKIDKAAEMLAEARSLVVGKDPVQEAFNNKWLGLISIKHNRYEEARVFLENAAKVIKEKELFEEIAGIDYLLAELYKEIDFYKAAEYFASGYVFENSLREVKERDEKIIGYYFDYFFGRSSGISDIC